MKHLVLLILVLGWMPLSAADDEVSCDDFPSCSLQAAAWEALGAGRYAEAVEVTEECTTRFGDIARDVQASLSGMPTGDDIDKAGVLNDVGTCYFIMGEALTKLGRQEEALAAYRHIVEEFSYAQAWDPRGWFWPPASPAAKSIALIEAQQQHDF